MVTDPFWFNSNADASVISRALQIMPSSTASIAGTAALPSAHTVKSLFFVKGSLHHSMIAARRPRAVAAPHRTYHGVGLLTLLCVEVREGSNERPFGCTHWTDDCRGRRRPAEAAGEAAGGSRQAIGAAQRSRTAPACLCTRSSSGVLLCGSSASDRLFFCTYWMVG
ncbi:hypothetical protein FA95DRAFT_1043928 [Auriscalpium vulgare]|uniref:Uncharacterized protein n=1 Tax=Auriscalpium vulgare TaxID=40419 RepID=A0ACB8R5T3_9AGAM|nr:hypothetical protein FA95DRAFT_1043928 [Auriscalpium vulgare]